MVYVHSDNARLGVFSFLQFTQKIKLLELSDVITAQINLHIPVLLSPRTSLYDLQKLRYDIYDHCDKARLSVIQFFAQNSPSKRRTLVYTYYKIFGLVAWCKF